MRAARVSKVVCLSSDGVVLPIENARPPTNAKTIGLVPSNCPELR